jgi:protoporphyrin/coproporphyrin ferrochelatase
MDAGNRHVFEGRGGAKFSYSPDRKDSDASLRVIVMAVRRELMG